nr:MAG: hypothetical protein [Bacteriophage sp.]
MKNNELLKKYAGISTRIRRIFAYHYDQIQREVQTEISTLTPELQAQFMDLWMGTKRGRSRGNHFPYFLFRYQHR